MGYQNEGASPNKYSGMKEYCEKEIKQKLSKVMKKASQKEEEIKSLKPTFEYRPDLEKETLTPVAAIDGGIATLFPNEVSETKLLKVAVGVPPEWQFILPEDLETYTHVFTGQLRWPDGVDKSFQELIQELIETTLTNKIILEACSILKISQEELAKALNDRANHLKSKGQESLTGFENNLRELLEVCSMVYYVETQKKNDKLLAHFQKYELLVPFLFIKDGTLYPSKITLSGKVADAVSDFFSSGEAPVLGVIKNSRFVNKDNIWSKVITEYAKEVKSHTFFRIPKKVELSIDSSADDIPFRRYFLSLFGGQSVFEIQIPKVLTQDEKKLKFILSVLAEQITFKYGGSISTNSYAHDRASLPEAEARFLTDDLRNDLKQLIKEYNDKKGKKE